MGMDIGTGGPDTTRPTPPAGIPNGGIAYETPRFPSMVNPVEDMPAADTVAWQAGASQVDAVTAAQAAAHQHVVELRDRYEAQIRPQGGSHGDLLALPEVVSDWSKHTGGTDAMSFDPAG
jgi:hypothetical protein